LTACPSGSASSGTGADASKIAPPSWLQGKWIGGYEQGSYVVTYEDPRIPHGRPGAQAAGACR